MINDQKRKSENNQPALNSILIAIVPYKMNSSCMINVSFKFNVVCYPFVEQSNMPETPAYGVYTSRLVCTARVCDSYKDFKLHHNNLCLKWYHQGFKFYKLCKHLKKTLQSHKVLFAKYDVRPEVPLPALASNTRHVMLHS